MRALLRALPDILSTIVRLAADPILPTAAKVALAAAALYLVSPIDLIPDFIPGIGMLDDLFVVAIVVDGVLNWVDRGLVLKYWPGRAESFDGVARAGPAQRACERTGEAVVGQEPRLDARAHGNGLAVECLDHRRPRQAPADDLRRRGLSVPGAPAARRRDDPRGHGVGPELVDAHDVAPAARRGDGSPVHADAIVARLLHGGGQRARRRLSRGRRPVRGGRRPDRGCCGVPDGNPDRVREGARARRGAL